MDLDLLVAEAVFRVRLIERALHDAGPWSMRYGGFDAPAVRLIAADRVIFRAHFPDVCWISDPGPTVLLLCDGETVSVQSIGRPEDGEFTMEWEIALPEPVHA
jgi:hypothetical protein